MLEGMNTKVIANEKSSETFLKPKLAGKIKPTQQFVEETVTKENLSSMRAKAQSGDLATMTNLGIALMWTENKDEGRQLLQQAADKNYAPAQFYYSMLLQDEGNKLALSYLDKAITAEFVPALEWKAQELLQAYSSDIGSKEQIVRYLTKAASLGSRLAAYRLGNLYSEGKQIGHNGVAGYYWLYLALNGYTDDNTKKQNPRGIYGYSRTEGIDSSIFENLAFLDLALTGLEGKEALKLLSQWTKTPPPNFPVELPQKDNYSRTEDTYVPEIITPQKIKDLNTKAESGDNNARFTLAKYYLDGRGVKEDDAKAIKLLEIAQKDGHEQSAFLLARIYEREDDREKKEKAREIYTTLADKGNPNAQIALIEFLDDDYNDNLDKTAEEANKKLAFELLTKAASQNNIWAMIKLGNHYERQKNYKKASELYERIAILGEPSGIEKLVGLAESERNRGNLYMWASIYTDTIPQANRIFPRQVIAMATYNVDKQILQSWKEKTEQWLRNNPEFLNNIQARKAEQEKAKNKNNTSQNDQTNPNIDTRNKQQIASLINAVSKNDLKTVNALIAEKVDLNVADNRANFLLHYAATLADTKILKALLDAKAIIDVQNSSGKTPLFLAVSEQNIEAVKMLLSAGADPEIGRFQSQPLLEAINQKNIELVKLLLPKIKDINVKSSKGENFLDAAIYHNDADELVELLLKAGANPSYINSYGETLLHQAVEKNNTKIVQLLLKHNIEINHQANDGDTALHEAVKDNNEELIKMLLKANADPYIKNKEGYTPWSLGMTSNKIGTVKLFLALKHDINAPINEDNYTILYHTVSSPYQKPEITALLLKAGANPNIKDKRGYTPLIAVSDTATDLPILKLLLEAGADPNATNEYGTALHRAARNKNIEAVKILLKAKADPNIKDSDGNTPLDETSDPEIEKLLTEAGGKSEKKEETPLFDELNRPVNKAAEKAVKERSQGKNNKPNNMILLNTMEESKEINATIEAENAGKKSPYLARAVMLNIEPKELKARIQSGIDVNGVDPEFSTPMFQAIQQKRSVEIIKCLLDNGADPNLETPLMHAAESCYVDAIPPLLKAGANPNIKNEDGNTPLIEATERGCDKIVELLLQAKADPNMIDKNGNAPLHVAIKQEKLKVIPLLLKAKANPNIQNKFGNTPLHNAAGDYYKEGLELLLKAKADPNIKNNSGDTALITLAKEGNEEGVDILLKAKANPNIQNREGNTALHIATQKDDEGIVELLLKAKANPKLKNEQGYIPLDLIVGDREIQQLLLKATK